MSALPTLLMTDDESGVMKNYNIAGGSYAAMLAALSLGKILLPSENVSAAGALSASIAESVIQNGTGGSFAVTLAAPASQDGQFKVIKAGASMLHTITLAMTNIKGPGFCTLSGTTTLTFTSAGDCAILMAIGVKWQLIGGNAVAS